LLISSISAVASITALVAVTLQLRGVQRLILTTALVASLLAGSLVFLAYRARALRLAARDRLFNDPSLAHFVFVTELGNALGSLSIDVRISLIRALQRDFDNLPTDVYLSRIRSLRERFGIEMTEWQVHVEPWLIGIARMPNWQRREVLAEAARLDI
jgi:hypothetical protein